MGVSEAESEEVHQVMLEKSPLGRLGQPNDVARLIVEQLENPNVTGAVWQVDGGYRWV